MDNPKEQTDRMLRLAQQAIEEAIASSDPTFRAKVIAHQVQFLAGLALRGAVTECRDARMTWPAIGEALGQTHTRVFRQYTNKNGGPMIAIQPAYEASSRNDHQTPLRQAANALIQQMTPLAPVLMGTATAMSLGRPVAALAHAMTVIDDPGPLLKYSEEVVATANGLAQHFGYPEAASSEQERIVWQKISEFSMVFARDAGLIRLAAELA